MRVLAETPGLFGPIRVLEREADGARLYCINQSIQTMIGPDGVSLFGYVHAAKLLLQGARKVLIIGGAGGSLATMLARKGHEVTVAELDRAAEPLARDFFGLDPRVRWRVGDGRALAADETFDAVFVDACDSHGLVADFDSAVALAALLASACPQGSLVLNVVREDGAPPNGEAVWRSLAAQGLHAILYRPQEGGEGNEVLHIRAWEGPQALRVGDVSGRPEQVRPYLLSLQAFHGP